MYQFDLLQKLGLSKTACRCYGSLLTDGSATAEDLGERLNLTANGLYRILQRLVEMGFAQSVKPYGHPTLYRAYGVNKAMNNYFEYQKQIIKPLSKYFPAEASKELGLSKYITELLENPELDDETED